MGTNTFYVLCMTGTLVLCSCAGKQSEKEKSTGTEDSTYLTLSPAQIDYAEISTTHFLKYEIADLIDCNGSIEADPNHEALVSPPLRGYLRRIDVHVGEYVNQGEVLAILQHPEYINLQQEYLEVQSQYEYYKEDFKRQGELSLENAASLKTMQQAQNEFRKIEARLFSLKKHLSFLGINADNLTVETIQSDVNLIAPISGYITFVDGAIGKLCTEEVPIFHIVGTNFSLLHLNVYEKDASRVQITQEINFSVISNPAIFYKARITAVSRAVDDSKTVSIHAMIQNKTKELMPGMFVKASILVNTDSVYALNEEAIVTKNGEHYIFKKIDSVRFEPIKIETGRRTNNMVEISNIPPDLIETEIVSSGAYYLFSEYTKEE
jgi:membrane fusion protein, heavy metal efflux system